MYGNDKGISSFIHPDGIYDEPKGGKLRELLNKKLRMHFQFINERMLFDIDHHVKFSLNIYSNNENKNYISMSNLFDPLTIDESIEGNQKERVPGIKDENGNWDIRGHKDRIINISNKELKLFSQLYDDEDVKQNQAKLPSIHAVQLLNTLSKFNDIDIKLRDFKNEYFSSECWHESTSQKEGILERNTMFAKNEKGLIVSGPHISILNPYFKTPRRVCKLNSDYDVIDLNNISKNYFQRTNYTFICNENELKSQIQFTQWGKEINDIYMLACRKMLSLTGERTLISSIIPKGSTHISGIYSISFKDNKLLTLSAALFASIPYDFFIRIAGKSNIQDNLCSKLPIPEGRFEDELRLRALLLNSVTESYKELWEELWKDSYNLDLWAKVDSRLSNNKFKKISKEWSENIPLRTEYKRRQALIEIDVLTSMALGMTLEELKTIYRIQFPVLYSYEADTWYDRNGRIIFTNNRGLTGVGLDRKRWNEVKYMTEGTVEHTIIDDTMPGGPIERTIVYEAPFDRCDREKDYEEVWKNFEERFKDK